MDGDQRTWGSRTSSWKSFNCSPCSGLKESQSSLPPPAGLRGTRQDAREPLPERPLPDSHPKGNQHPQFLGIFSEICYTKMSRYTFIVFPTLSPMVVCCLHRSVPHCLLYVMTRVFFPTFSPPQTGLFEVLLLSIHLPIINVLKP